ncbi:hypothetical protein BE11_50735 [Sorangium cellulosum]|nr:hypothetical protein BE11_50735 [Sorangium cellulosum]
MGAPGRGGSSARATPIRGEGASAACGDAADDAGKLAGRLRGAQPASAATRISRAFSPTR